VQAFEGRGIDAGRMSPRKRRLAFLRAIEYSADLRLPLSVPQFAAATGVHQRVLELVFHEALGVTPRKYLRWNRMNQAHRELLATVAGSASVKEIAAQWGFSEPGRFAVEYKHLFGESPSKTLARSAHPPRKRLTEILLRP
jgi:transcriptional regulator GlxA family with amidase domain